MFFPEGDIRVDLHGQPTDMRKSFDTQYALARLGLLQDPLSGHRFAFVTRRATYVQVLYFDRSASANALLVVMPICPVTLCCSRRTIDG